MDTWRSAPAPRVGASAQLSGLSTSLACQCCSKAGTFKFTFYRRSSCSPNPGSAGCQLSWSQLLVYSSLFASLVVVVALHVFSGHRRSLYCTFCFHRCRSEAIQGVSLSRVSEHAFIPWPCRGTISWSGSRVSLASRSYSLTLRSLRTHLDCCLLLVQVVGHICPRSCGSARRLLSRRVLFLQGEGPHATSCFQRSRKEWTYGNALVGVFNDFLAYLPRVANGSVLRSRLFVDCMSCIFFLAVLEWTSTS